MDKGVEKLVAISPFPDPGMGLGNVQAWKFYREIVKTYTRVAERYPSKFLVLDYTHLVAYKTDPDAGIFYERDGVSKPNLSIRKVKIGLSHDCRVMWDPNLAVPVYKQLKKIAARLESMNSEENGVSSERIRGILSVKDPVGNNKRAHPKKVSFQKVDAMSSVTDKEIDAKMKSSSRKTTNPRGEVVESTPIAINFGKSQVFNLKCHIGTKSYYGLVDTGADWSVVDPDFAAELRMIPGANAHTFSLSTPVELVFGDGGSSVLDSALSVDILLKPADVVYSVLLVIVPGLVEKIIFGNDFFAAVGAQICYQPPGIKFTVGGSLVAVDVAYGRAWGTHCRKMIGKR